MLAIGLMIFGIISRFFVQWPNFTPVIAIALFAGVYLPKKQTVFVPVAIFVIADFIRGFHVLIPFTWGSMALIALTGIYFKNRKSWKNIAGASVLSAALFYIITNFGVWLVYTTYPKTILGLVECYAAGIPYFKNTLLSTALYTFVLFGSFELLAARIRNTRFKFVL